MTADDLQQVASRPADIESAFPSVSVVIPAYNARSYIEAAVLSACAQTLRDIEIIVVDDASTDDTPAILAGLAARDSRIRLARLPVNAGPGPARNRGLAMARGAWIALLDSDDRFEPQRLETLLALAQRERADVVADNVALHVDGVDSLHRIIPATRLSAPRPMNFEEFIAGAMLNLDAPKRVNYVFMHPMFSRAFLQTHAIAYNPHNRNGEDLLFYIDCFLAGARWFMTPEPMYLYSIRAGSLTEIKSRADSHRMVRRLRTLLRDPRITRDPALAAAIRGNYQANAIAHYFWPFKAAASAGDFRGLLATLTCDRTAAPFIAREIVRRAPIALRRRLA